LIVRACTADDLPHVQAIYAHHVLTGVASFEEIPPKVDEIRSRHERIVQGGYPFLVAVLDGSIAGYAYASEYRPRSGYRYTCESSVYVAPGTQRRGVGRALMLEVIALCERRGLREMLAVIGDSANEASIALHAALGFRHTGTFHRVGFKFGRWVDTVLMQRQLHPAGRSFVADAPQTIARSRA
jgi:L-amino acid N-acyltransferase YncA